MSQHLIASNLFAAVLVVSFVLSPTFASALAVSANFFLIGLLTFLEKRESSRFDELDKKMTELKNRVDSLMIRKSL